MRRRLPILLPLLLILLPAGPSWSGEAAKDLKAKDVATRLAAIEAIRKDPPPDAEKLLLGALTDRDWEVIEKAAGALRELGTRAALAPLLKLAIVGPVRRIRIAAACEALAVLGRPAGPHPRARLGRVAGGPSGPVRDPTRLRTEVGSATRPSGRPDRGAGVVGLAHVGSAEIIPDLIDALGDRDPAVARSAWEALVRLTTKTIAPPVKAWRKWWASNRSIGRGPPGRRRRPGAPQQGGQGGARPVGVPVHHQLRAAQAKAVVLRLRLDGGPDHDTVLCNAKNRWPCTGVSSLR